MIDLELIEKEMGISFKLDDLYYLRKLIPGDVESLSIPFTIDEFESETTIGVIYDAHQIIEKTEKYNVMCLDNDITPLSKSNIIIAEDVGGSPIILDTIFGGVYLFWFDFDCELALLFKTMGVFYSSLKVD